MGIFLIIHFVLYLGVLSGNNVLHLFHNLGKKNRGCRWTYLDEYVSMRNSF